eukprot:12862185-Ditylum_brightwellii.AAC.1
MVSNNGAEITIEDLKKKCYVSKEGMASAKKSFEKQEDNILKLEKKKGPVESVILKMPNNSTMKSKEEAAG